MIVVPTLGLRPQYFEQTLGSVTAQEGVQVHFVVVAPRAASHARVVTHASKADLIDDPGGGLSAAINAGLALAWHDDIYANWLGADDLLAPARYARVHDGCQQRKVASQAELVKRRYVDRFQLHAAWMWERPVLISTRAAVRR